jgi:hypothetical protein
MDIWQLIRKQRERPVTDALPSKMTRLAFSPAIERSWTGGTCFLTPKKRDK